MCPFTASFLPVCAVLLFVLSSCAVTGSMRFVMMHVGMWSPFSKPLTFRSTWALPRMCMCMRKRASSVCLCDLKNGYLDCLLKLVSSFWVGDAINELWFCSSVSHPYIVLLRQQWNDSLRCAVPLPHSEGSMVGDNDINPLPGPGSLITPTLLGSFHTILTSVDSSCQNECHFLSFTLPHLLKKCLHRSVNLYKHALCLLINHLGKWESNLS